MFEMYEICTMSLDFNKSYFNQVVAFEHGHDASYSLNKVAVFQLHSYIQLPIDSNLHHCRSGMLPLCHGLDGISQMPEDPVGLCGILGLCCSIWICIILYTW
jgi:hypothetical protein